MSGPLFHRLVIHGVGLLGGSLGMALRARGMVRQVVGLGRSIERLEQARARGAVDCTTTEPAEALRGSDALILCIPPRQIREQWEELARWLEPATFVTDVGSVKARIVAEAERALPPHVRFIGSHPIAGSEKTGVAHARADLFAGSVCVLTPTQRTASEVQELAARFWQALGARVLAVDPEIHDELLAGTSHLPHLVAAALMQALRRRIADAGALAELAGPGLRDTTRIAAADPEVWSQILSENAPAVIAGIDALQEVLGQWRAALAGSAPNVETLRRLYAEGRDARLALNNRPGTIGEDG